LHRGWIVIGISPAARGATEVLGGTVAVRLVVPGRVALGAGWNRCIGWSKSAGWVCGIGGGGPDWRWPEWYDVSCAGVWPEMVIGGRRGITWGRRSLAECGEILFLCQVNFCLAATNRLSPEWWESGNDEH